MDSETMKQYLTEWTPVLTKIGFAILIFIAGWIASKWARNLVTKAFSIRKMDKALGSFLASLLQYTVLTVAIIAALGKVGLETTSLVAVFASAGLAIGLALQGSLSNFASGVMILLFRPFNLGDKVTVAGHTGGVTDIGIFTTTLLTLDNERIIIPNGAIMGDSIVNFATEKTLRGCVTVGVEYGADVSKVLDVLKKAAAQTDLVLKDPAPAVAFVDLGASSLDFNVFAWCNWEDYLDMLHNLRKSVYDSLNEAGIEIPFNQIVVHKQDA